MYVFISQIEPKLNGDQTFTPRRSRRRVSDCSSVQSEQSVSVVVKNRKRSPPNIGSLTEEQSEIQPNGEAESHSGIF